MTGLRENIISFLLVLSLAALLLVARRNLLPQFLSGGTQQAGIIGLGLAGSGLSCSTRGGGGGGSSGGGSGSGGSLGNIGTQSGPTPEEQMSGIWKTCSDRGLSDPTLVPTNMETPAQIQVIQTLMGSHQHRVMHALWHLMRTALTEEQVDEITQAYGAAWASPHTMCPMPTNVVDANYNPYGEDFLYMHRKMVYSMQDALISAGLPCIGPWTTLPVDNDPVWPIPDANGQGVKSDAALETMQNWEAAFNDPNWLSIHSLSQLGFMLEVTLHNNMHQRWATLNPPPGFTTGAPLPFNGVFPTPWPYDDTSYDWLADTYSSQTNIAFWKLHGIVDQIVDKWLLANGYSTIAVNCNGNPSCYTWQGTWVGDPTDLPNPSGMSFAVRQANQVIAQHSQVGMFSDGLLTEDRIARTRGMRASTTSSWTDDPEAFVDANFCQ